MSDRTSTSPFFVRVRTSLGNVAMVSASTPQDDAKNLGSSAGEGVPPNDSHDLPPGDSHGSEVRQEPLSAGTPGGGAKCPTATRQEGPYPNSARSSRTSCS